METGINHRYISRILPLAFLAPDITEAILDGKQSAHLALKDYVQSLSMEWNAQKRELSLSQRN
jgi:site-specific DNA recombinase